MKQGDSCQALRIIQVKHDGGTDLDSDNGDERRWMDLCFNVEIKSTSAHLLGPFILLTYNKESSSGCLANSIGFW